MTDAVSDMLRDRSETKKKDANLPMVTAIIKYDCYPYYQVIRGTLQMDGGVVHWGNKMLFSQEYVLRILPEEAFETQNILLGQVKDSYVEQERELCIDILKQHGVDFVTLK